ncbi:hypothetical protein N301_14929, partial [Charadrius vociferus]
ALLSQAGYVYLFHDKFIPTNLQAIFGTAESFTWACSAAICTTVTRTTTTCGRQFTAKRDATECFLQQNSLIVLFESG